MKRAVNLILIFAMALGFLAFQCQSTEMTSAKLYIQQKNLPKAKQALMKEVKKNPKSDEGYYLLGWIYGEEGNYDKMLENFNKSLEISKKFEQKIKQSRKYHWAQNFNKGVALFNKAAKASDKESQKKFFDKAVQAFEYATKCEPDSAATYQNLAFAYLNAGESEKAVKPLLKLRELKNTPEVYVRLGQIYFNKGVDELNKFQDTKAKEDSIAAMKAFDTAISYLEEGRKKYPSNSDILLLLSNAYIKANKIDVAMDAFKAGVEQEPNNKYYRYNYGVLLLGADRFAEAAEQFKKALEIDPKYENAIYNLAVTYVKWGAKLNEEALAKGEESDAYKEKYKEAYPYLEQYLQIRPDEANVWELLGKVYANLGMTEKSKEAFQKADALRK
jgi:tetratricopeptide (TPR) repeat protein